MVSETDRSGKREVFESSVSNGSTTATDRSSTSSCRSSSDTSPDDAKPEFSSSPVRLGWPIGNAQLSKRSPISDVYGDEHKPRLDSSDYKKLSSSQVLQMDMMKERFAKLLLGEDMSGSGKGVCTALAISNSITNLWATVFGQLWRLEPLSSEKKSMWRREMDWLLCISDHIVELKPSWQTFPDGTKLEVMVSKPRTDLFVNLPALSKLDNMLLGILDSFRDREFWYVDQGLIAEEADKGDASVSFCKSLQRQEEKWWLPVPRVPLGGLHETTRKELNHKRECANQILKASMAINSIALSEMEVPDSYLEALPKNGRACLGDVIYRYITSEQFSAECLLDCLDLTSEHSALETANCVEASIHVWYRRIHSKPIANPNPSTSKSSWQMVKDLMVVDGDKSELLARRAESLLLCLKHRFPGLTQTNLETSKIQCNKDVGKAILESYSRVLESLAFNIVSRIDDLLYVDDLTRESNNKVPRSPMVSVIGQKKVPISYAVPVSATPYKSAFATPKRSPAPMVSPAKGAKTPLLIGNSNKPPGSGFGVKRVLTNYLGG